MAELRGAGPDLGTKGASKELSWWQVLTRVCMGAYACTQADTHIHFLAFSNLI